LADGSVVARLFLGEFELLVLLSVLHTEDAAYGVTIREAIEARTGRPVARGALYLTLERLVDKGYLRSWTGDASAQRAGKPRKYYQVEQAGLAAIKESRTMLREMWRGLESVLGKV
jgi:DNA-binding PadR family transcriptional regulator